MKNDFLRFVFDSLMKVSSTKNMTNKKHPYLKPIEEGLHLSTLTQLQKEPIR